MTEINRELFRKVHAAVTAEPEHHNQRSYESTVDAELEWLDQDADDYDEELEYATHRVDGATICGTTRCTAGWTLYLHNPTQDITQTAQDVMIETNADETEQGWYCSPLFSAAQRLLGLNKEQAEELFAADLSETDAVQLIAGYAGLND